MIKRLALAILAASTIAACNPSQKMPHKDTEIDLTDPFAALLPWNPDRDDIIKTDSGLQYVILKSGAEGGVSPQPADQVVVNYDGRLNKGGKKFDSSFDRGAPETFPAGGLIPGWVEALALMKPGDEWMLFIPSDLGYGAMGAGADIPPNADLVFRVALEDVYPAPTADAEAWAKYRPWPSDAEEVQKTGSGLEYVVLEQGNPEGESPRPQDFVVVHYEGRFAESGDVFDSSFARGEPARFPAGRLIQGWVEGLGLMKEGDRWLMYIPYDLAYGEEGKPPTIPGKSDLMFEVQLGFVMRVADEQE